METVALSSTEHLELSWGRLFPLEGGKAGSQPPAAPQLACPAGEGHRPQAALPPPDLHGARG